MRKLFLFIIILLSHLCFIEAQTLENEKFWTNGVLHIINSSHQDIAWVDAPEVCIRNRDEKILTPLLDRMETNPLVRYSVEDALTLKEYLERHPERYEQILKFTREGRLEWGATLKQPYHSMYDGEALIRQTYFGRKWELKHFPGCEFTTAWNQDVPGMALQFPQILAKSGIRYYQFSRHAPGFYKWFSPDGSSVLGWTTGQYDEAGIPVRNAENEEARTNAFISLLASWTNTFKEKKIAPQYPFLYSYDFALPVNWDVYMKKWNDEVKGDNLKNLPAIQYSTATMAMDAIMKNGDTKFTEIVGERPNIWLYIHGPTHHRAIKACRDASRTLAAAEIFSTFSALQQNSFSAYPQEKLNNGWENAIYPDHGFGGLHGDITDRLFRTKFEKGLAAGQEVLKQSTQDIASRIKFERSSFKAITVFNSLAWERTDPITITIDMEGRRHTHFRIYDPAGNEVSYQLISKHAVDEKNDEVLTFLFVADKVPSMGYKTFYLTEVQESVIKRYDIPDVNNRYENNFYSLSFGRGGLKSVFDKELKKELFNTTKFNAGELFTMKSVGNGAGEFVDVQKPTMEEYDKLGNYSGAWQCIEVGPVRDVFQLIQPMKENQAVVRVNVFKQIKRIDFDVEINGFTAENWREFRLAFPMNQTKSKISYEVPMGVVEVGKDELAGAAGFSKASQIYSTPNVDIHPREVQNWFSATDGNSACTISSDVAVFDWIDPTTSPVDYAVLQPVLLASRQSCHWLGTHYYLQPGNHSFTFTLYSHANNWKSGYRLGTQAKQPLVAAVTDSRRQSGTYPDQFSFMETKGKGIMVSAVKKADDDDSMVLRCFDIEGKDSDVSFELFRPVSKVQQTNLIELEGVKIPGTLNGFKTPIGHYSIETFKVNLNR